MTREDLKKYLVDEAEYSMGDVDIMSPYELIDAYLCWNGIINYTEDIIDVVLAALEVEQ